MTDMQLFIEFFKKMDIKYEIDYSETKVTILYLFDNMRKKIRFVFNKFESLLK